MSRVQCFCHGLLFVTIHATPDIRVFQLIERQRWQMLFMADAGDQIEDVMLVLW